MKNTKLNLLIAVFALSAYICQRAMSFLSGDFTQVQRQEQSQVESAVYGVSLSFSYEGMDIFWPIILAICLIGYCKTEAPESNNFLVEGIEKSRGLKYLALTIFPLFVIILHFSSIGILLLESFGIVGKWVEQVLSATLHREHGQGDNQVPTGAAISAFAYLVLSAASFAIFVFAINFTLRNLRHENPD